MDRYGQVWPDGSASCFQAASDNECVGGSVRLDGHDRLLYSMDKSTQESGIMSQRWTVEVSDTPDLPGMREKGIYLEDLRRAYRDTADRCIQSWKRKTHSRMGRIPWVLHGDDYEDMASQFLPLAVLMNEMSGPEMWIYDYHDHHPEPGTVIWDADSAELIWYPREDRSWYLKAYVPGETEPILPDWL